MQKLKSRKYLKDSRPWIERSADDLMDLCRDFLPAALAERTRREFIAFKRKIYKRLEKYWEWPHGGA